MNDIVKDEEIEIDIGRILKALLRNWLYIVVSAAVGTAIAFLLMLLITPKYQSAVTFYVKNSAFSSSGSISAGDIAASKELVDSYLVILQSGETLDALIHYTQSSRTPAELRNMIHGAAVNSTEFFRVEVTSQNPREAEKIANAIGCILPLRIAGIVEGASAKVVDAALVSFDPKDPGYGMITAAGFLLGLGASVLVIAVQAVVEKTIRCREDIEKISAYPILACVPERANYLAGSYKDLGTKLQVLLPEEKACRVIGVTGTRQGDGASSAAVNLACCLRRRGARVILVDCDLLASRLAKRQGLPEGPGLADFLAGKCTLDQTVRHCFRKKKNLRFPVIPAGKKYIQGAELLLSKRMPIALRALRKISDYVILDLPSADRVSETVELARMTDGNLLVVRRDKSSRDALQETTEKLEFVQAPILGVLYHGDK